MATGLDPTGVGDSTAGLQALLNSCFGSPMAPNGLVNSRKNKVCVLPPGKFKTTAPLNIKHLVGGRIIGAGRFVTQIQNVTPGSPVIVTNGCAYAHFEGFHIKGSGDATLFDLDWDGWNGGLALQSNTFTDIFLDGGAIGINIGASDYMGSENEFRGFFCGGQSVAGLKTSNYNALQQSVIGGNFQNCARGIWAFKGSVPIIQGTGFQVNSDYDIQFDNSAHDTAVISGCRSESKNFVRVAGKQHAVVQGCSQTASASGHFVNCGNSPVTVERCVSLNGSINVDSWGRATIRGSSFGRTDWINSVGGGSVTVEIEDVQYGGTPNSPTGNEVTIQRRRITQDGAFDYDITPA